MKIAVCIKQVPDTAEVRINPETGTLIREGVPSIINPFDMHAIEAGLKLRDEAGQDSTVVVVTMGPPQAEDALRQAISMGCNQAILLSDKAFAGADTWATSWALSKAMQKIKPDVIICGKQAIDGDTAQVGPEVAEMMGIPHVAYVRKIEAIEEGKMTVQRMMDGGYDRVETGLPVLLTVVRELNEPRLPSLKGKMAARKATIPVWGAKDIEADEADLGLKGSPTQVKKIFAPEARSDRQMIEGIPEEQATALAEKLMGSKCE